MPYRKLCAAVMCAAFLTPSALALYPSEMQAGAVGSSPELMKIYELTPEDSPDDIPRDSFELDGYKYSFFEILRDTPLPTTETKEHSETVTLTSQSKDMEAILSLLATEKECTTEDGYEGTLRLNVDSIHSEVAGYGSSSKKVSITRRYPNLADADLEFIPKTTTENGVTYTLGGVQWETSNTTDVDGYALTNRYTAVATYSGTQKSKYVDGYSIRATYSGILSKSHTPVTRYTAIFVGKLIDPAVQRPAGSTVVPEVPGKVEEDEPPADAPIVQEPEPPEQPPEAEPPLTVPMPWKELLRFGLGALAFVGGIALVLHIGKRIDFQKLGNGLKKLRLRKERRHEEEPDDDYGDDLPDDDGPVYPGFGADV